MEKGNLSINSENILPIIKKWLYSDTDIFIRELVSNAADAINKLKQIIQMGEADHISSDEAYAVKVVLDKEAKTIKFIDNGIGMTADEIKEYINQIAFSGASDFINKYKDKLDKESEIIGHFGLGFYSSFMVSDRVQIDTLSYKENSSPVRWICDGGIEYELSDSDRTTRGTTVTLYVNDESKDFLEEFKLREILIKYCNFIPVEIYFENVANTSEADDHECQCGHHHDDGHECECEHHHDDGHECECEHHHDDEHECECEHHHDDEHECECEHHKADKKPKPINDVSPLWLKQPKDCTEQEYKDFYHKVFMDFNDPLFWIHLNMDYPFRLKGILYFPKLKHELESIEGQVKLYNNQVYIADNIKEVIPEFLLLLKGTIDCPDLPLNVSRSFLQNDGYVTKMSGYISRKVADKLNSLFKTERETFNTFWDDISPFIKYGCIKDRSFYDKVKDSLLFKTTVGDYTSLSEFLERNKEKTADKVYYVSNEQQQAQYIKLFTDQGLEAVILTTGLDNPFISYLESYEHNVHFNRIDSDLTDTLKDDQHNEDDGKELEELFKTGLNNDKLKVKVESLKTANISAIILLSEQSRRMQEMSKMFGGNMPPMFESDETLVLNMNNPLVQKLTQLKSDSSRKEDVDLICAHIYDLALMSHKPLGTDEMTRFIERSNILLERMAAR